MSKFSNKLATDKAEEIKEELDRDGVVRSPTGNDLMDPLILSQDEAALQTVGGGAIDLSATAVGGNLI